MSATADVIAMLNSPAVLNQLSQAFYGAPLSEQDAPLSETEEDMLDAMWDAPVEDAPSTPPTDEAEDPAAVLQRLRARDQILRPEYVDDINPPNIDELLRRVDAFQKRVSDRIVSRADRSQTLAMRPDYKASGQLCIYTAPAPWPALALDSDVAIKSLQADLPKAIFSAYTKNSKWGSYLVGPDGTVYIESRSSKKGMQAAAVLSACGATAKYIGSSLSAYQEARAAKQKGDGAKLKALEARLLEKVNAFLPSSAIASPEMKAEQAAILRTENADPRLQALVDDLNAAGTPPITVADLTDEQIREAIPELGLIAFMNGDPAQRNLFIQYMRDTYALENLAFLVVLSPHLKAARPACREFISGMGAANTSSARIRWIFDQFVSSGSTFTINLSSGVRAQCYAQLQDPTASLDASAPQFYSAALLEMSAFLNSSFTNFRAELRQRCSL